MTKITVVIPTYNESDNIPGLARALLDSSLYTWLVFVDDNSPDGTGAILDNMARSPWAGGRIEVIHRSARLGLGSAYVMGLKRALLSGARLIAQMDADGSHDPARLPDMVELLRFSGLDLVIGSRYVEGGGIAPTWGGFRLWLSAFANRYIRFWLGLPLRDCTGAFRVWRSQALERIPLDQVRSNGYAFLAETLYIAYRLGLQIGESPIYFDDRQGCESKMSLDVMLEAAGRVPLMPLYYRGLECQTARLTR